MSHIPIILLSLVEAGSTLRKKTSTEREDLITNRLYRELVRIPVFRDGPLNIQLQPEILSPDPEKDTPGGKIDLLVPSDLGNEVYFAIEAKRLRFRSPAGRPASGTHEYITEGMMRFVNCKYAPKMHAGAMLGYVFDGKLDKARSSIDRSIRKKAITLKLLPPERLARSTILPEKPIDETGHNLVERLFTVYHLLLAV